MDAAIAEYMVALPEKVDAVAHVIHTLESQIALAKVEAERDAAVTVARRQTERVPIVMPYLVGPPSSSGSLT